MATEELNPPADNAHGPELPPMMPLGQPGAYSGDPNGDAAWLAAQAAGMSVPTDSNASYQGMSRNPPGSGTHAAHPYESYKHEGREP